MRNQINKPIKFLTFFALGIMLFPTTTRGDGALIADLSKDHITIQSNFSGEKLLLFGAIDAADSNVATDIVVVLRSPAEDFMVRRKQKHFGIWINSDSFLLGPLPSFFAMSSSRALDRIAPAGEQKKHALLPRYLSTNLQNMPQKEVLDGFIRLRHRAGLYSANEQGVTILNNRLFRAEIDLPSGMPVGTYVTEFFAFRRGRLVGYQTGELPVDIVGAGHILHQAAHENPLIYGLVGVMIAGFMGWGGALVFRRK